MHLWFVGVCGRLRAWRPLLCRGLIGTALSSQPWADKKLPRLTGDGAPPTSSYATEPPVWGQLILFCCEIVGFLIPVAISGVNFHRGSRCGHEFWDGRRRFFKPDQHTHVHKTTRCSVICKINLLIRRFDWSGFIRLNKMRSLSWKSQSWPIGMHTVLPWHSPEILTKSTPCHIWRLNDISKIQICDIISTESLFLSNTYCVSLPAVIPPRVWGGRMNGLR
jgi:hypothetical protein